MAEEFFGDVDVFPTEPAPPPFRAETIHLDGDKGEIFVGSTMGQAGSLYVRDHGRTPITLQGGANSVWIRNDGDVLTIVLDGSSGVIVLNGGEQAHPHADVQRVRLDGETADITLGGNGADGDVNVRNKDGKRTVYLDGDAGNITLGGNGTNGDVYVRNKGGQNTVRLDGQAALITLGDNGTAGRVFVRNKDAQNTVQLDGPTATIIVGDEGADGSISVRNSAGKTTMKVDRGDITLGGNGARGNMFLRDKAGKDTIHLDGEAGDIVLLNADCAEEFDVSETEGIEPGTVLVLDGQGALRPSTRAYDRRVAGVVSGAEDTKPGIVLGRQPASTSRVPVALVGTVHCKVDAQYGPVEVGDLLTTSPTPGHAMKALDPLQAFGAVIGKALRSLKKGRELVPIIVALQ
jgi:hypothetical protein